MRAHVYQDRASADTAVAIVNQITGYPKPDGQTKSYCMVEEIGGVIFIQADERTEEILGAAQDVTFNF